MAALVKVFRQSRDVLDCKQVHRASQDVYFVMAWKLGMEGNAHFMGSFLAMAVKFSTHASCPCGQEQTKKKMLSLQEHFKSGVQA